MPHPSVAGLAMTTCAAAGIALSACGSSTSSSSAAPGGASSESSFSSAVGSFSVSVSPVQSPAPGSPLCIQLANVLTVFAPAGSSDQPLQSVLANSDIAGVRTALAHDASAIDSAAGAVDGSVPSEIAAALQTLRAVFDQLNRNVQNATSRDQLAAAFAPLAAEDVRNDELSITSWVSIACGVGPSSTSST